MCAVFWNPYEIICELCDTIYITTTALKKHSKTLEFKKHMIGEPSLKEDSKESTDAGIYWPIPLQLHENKVCPF